MLSLGDVRYKVKIKEVGSLSLHKSRMQYHGIKPSMEAVESNPSATENDEMQNDVEKNHGMAACN